MLDRVHAQKYDLILLDLELSGRDGLEILSQLRVLKHRERVVGIANPQNMSRAVEAMKLGAADVIQKPLTPKETADVLKSALSRHANAFQIRASSQTIDANVLGNSKYSIRPHLAPEAEDRESYSDCLEQAKAAIELQEFSEAIQWAKRAVGIESGRPEGFNVLGVLMEIEHDVRQAQKFYRAAISLDPTYEPAQRNLHRTTMTGSLQSQTDFDLSLGLSSGKETK